MNTLFVSNLTGLPTRLTGSATLFKQASFIACSGFNASGVPIYGLNRLFLGTSTSYLPIVIPAGNTGVSFNSFYENAGIDDLSNYYVMPTNTGDGCYVYYN